MNIGFWNLNKKKLDSLVYNFAKDNDLQVLILGESNYEPNELLLILNEQGNDYYFAPTLICDRIQFYTKFSQRLLTLVQETKRISARKLFSPKFGDIILIAAHYNSKVNWTSEDQSANIPAFKSLIDSVENKLGHKRTIICGDFNMNPFDTGMIQSTGLHSVMEKNIAYKQNRIVDGETYDYFYNPMWGFLGDLGKGEVSGTMYYSPSKPINYHWNLFDQVLVRPDLIASFVDDKLEIVTRIGKINLLTENKIINKNYSDHLPLKFKINI